MNSFFIIPNFLQPKANISSDMQLTLPFIKAQTTSRRKTYTPLASFEPRGGKMFHGISCIEKWFLLFNGFVLVFKQSMFKKTMHLPGFSGGHDLLSISFLGEGTCCVLLQKVGGWIIQPQKRYWHFVRWLFMAFFLKSFDVFFPNGSVASWTWNDLIIISYALMRTFCPMIHSHHSQWIGQWSLWSIFQFQSWKW